jgi:hypothetical protein
MAARIDQDTIRASRRAGMQGPVADDAEISRQARLQPAIESMEEHHRQREADIRDLIEAVALLLDMPADRLLAVPPIRGDAAQLMAHARRIKARL